MLNRHLTQQSYIRGKIFNQELSTHGALFSSCLFSNWTRPTVSDGVVFIYSRARDAASPSGSIDAPQSFPSTKYVDHMKLEVQKCAWISLLVKASHVQECAGEIQKKSTEGRREGCEFLCRRGDGVHFVTAGLHDSIQQAFRKLSLCLSKAVDGGDEDTRATESQSKINAAILLGRIKFAWKTKFALDSRRAALCSRVE